MTDWEKQRYGNKYPFLDVEAVQVTGEISRRYNCISWSVGVTSRWIWPGYTKRAFDILYARYGIRPAETGGIALWETLPHHPGPHPRMTHACIAKDSAGKVWESKCGGLLRITHGLTELYGDTYGRPYAFYHSLHSKMFVMFEGERTPPPLPELTPQQKARLAQKAAAISAAVRKQFEILFAEWQETWMSEDVAFDSDPAARAAGPAFQQLVAMGKQILPLVAEKMEDPENFFALQLFAALLAQEGLRPSFIPGPDPEHPDILEGEQGRARATLRGWLDMS